MGAAMLLQATGLSSLHAAYFAADKADYRASHVLQPGLCRLAKNLASMAACCW